KLGPFMIKYGLAATLISGMIGYLIVKQWIRKNMETEQEIILNVLGNGILLSVVIWKLSAFLFNPHAVLKNPSMLLYFSGGYKGWIVAIVLIFIYIYFQSRKKSIDHAIFFQMSALGFSVASTVYYLFAIFIERIDFVFHLGQVIVSFLFIWWFYKQRSAQNVF